jgi:transposase
MKQYSIREFRKEFPNEKSCLDYIFAQKHPDKVDTHYFVKGRKCYADAKGKQIHPVKGTVFEHSSTPLTLWFYAIYLFSASRNGVSAKELQRQIGCTYKTAWRMAKQIRALMAQGDFKLSGMVEIDETLIGGKKYFADPMMKNKSSLMGMVERKGKIKAFKVEDRSNFTLLNKIDQNIHKGSKLITDEWVGYRRLSRYGYKHRAVVHSRKQYARGIAHTNTIEGFWGQFKTSLRGTYHSVSKKYLQSYVDEFSFRRNASPAVFEAMVARI